MGSPPSSSIFLFTFLLILQNVTCIRKSDIFPFGRPAGDEKLDPNKEDASSKEIRLSTNIKFFDTEYDTVFVNENGLLSFLTEIPSYFNVQFPLDYPLIAALYSDVDARGAGSVWYRTTSDPTLLARAERKLERGFQGSGFRPSELVIVTWDRVGYYEERGDLVNSFQIVVATSEDESYVLMLYPEGGIQWIKGGGKNKNAPDARAQAGIVMNQERHLLVRGSGEDQVKQLDKWSNANEAGVWMFKVGNLGPSGEVQEPEVTLASQFDPSTAESCGVGASLCHSRGVCVDHNPGFCCKCAQDMLGNGRTCIPKADPQRVSGRVSGEVNSISFEDQDLHCYVVTQEGRTYTAISKIPGPVGSDMRGLTPIGSPIAWLFAQSIAGSENGFDITGGKFNYSAEVTFPDTGHAANIDFAFNGLDSFDYLSAKGSISGTLPPIYPAGAEIEVADYSEEFSKVRPGLISASSERSYSIVGTNDVVNFKVTHTIEYEGCEAEGIPAEKRTMRLKSSRNYIVFDENEEVVRYAMTTQVVPLGADEDPCREFTCASNSYCLASDGVAGCVCSPGFEEYVAGDASRGCVDVDECSLATDDCDANAECINQSGSYRCVCDPGFVGNGVDCQIEITCDTLNCDENADCGVDMYGQPVCECLPGFEGDGNTCEIVPSDLRLSGYAEPENIVFDNLAPENDVGTANLDMRQFYQVTNLGPHTVGGVKIRITWPFQDLNGKFITYLTEAPYVRYTGPMGEYNDPCEIDPMYINPSEVGSKKRKRRKREEDEIEYGGEEFDYLTEEERRKLMNYDASYDDDTEYDYSHFEKFNTESPPARHNGDDFESRIVPLEPNMPPMPTITPYPQPEGLPEPVDEANEEYETKSVQNQVGPGQITATCRVNLAAQESALITFKGRLNPETLIQDYAGIAQFVIPSLGEIEVDDSIRAMGSPFASVSTRVEPKDPALAMEPGKGVQCGDITCDKYADCSRTFAGVDETKCQCVPGFKGDGVTCEQLDVEEGRDCRKTKDCSRDAACQFNEDTEIFQCLCNNGFEGNGFTCYAVRESCDLRNDCDPMANCVQDYRGEFVCQCQRGYEGDGYTCYSRGRYPGEDQNQGIGNNYGGNTNPGYGSNGDDYGSNNYVNPGQPGDNRLQATCDDLGCYCPQGYVLDGDICLVQDVEITSPKPLDLCQTSEECDVNAQCGYNDEQERNVCICNEYYVGNGFTCQPGPDAGCDIKEDCGRDAECVDENGDYVCRCKDGFKGDGYFCKKDVIGCNIIDNCGEYALCLFDASEGGYRCQCDQARGFSGDGYLCQPRVTCLENRNLCDRNAECAPNNPDDWQAGASCKCRVNFLGDGYACAPVPTFDGNYLIVSQGMALMKVPFGATKANPGIPLLVRSMQTATGLDVDCLNGKVYWTDTSGKSIRRANYDGSGFEVFLDRNMGFPEGLAVDWVSRNLYWSDSGKKTIEVVNLDTKVRATVFEYLVNNPRGIAVHPSIGRMFWTDWQRDRPRIEAANLDGSDRATLVDNMLGMPNSLAVDFLRYQLCWSDGGSPLMHNRAQVEPKIECMDLSGQNRRPIVSLNATEMPYGITLTEENVFWTDWKRPNVHGARRDDGGRLNSLPHILSSMGKPFGLVSIPNECPQATSACSNNPCPGNQICLPNARGGFVCRCGDGDENCVSGKKR